MSTSKTIDFITYKGSSSGQIVQAKGHRELKPGQAIVRITHSGVCGTDAHFLHTDMALGHEGVGVVEAVYPGVTQVKPGDRVGFGYVHWTCGECKVCLSGYDQYCLNREEFITHNRDQGSYGSHVVWSAKNLYVLPDGLESRYAGPLMCGGATVWGALIAHGKPVVAGDIVGIIGVGGLGHMAIQFASALGAEVIVFSSTEDKREEALGFGADQFVATKGIKKFGPELERMVDHLLITSSSEPDFSLYLPIMAMTGTIYPLTVSFDETPVPFMPIVTCGISLQGSATASSVQQKKMLHFVAKHGIKPAIMEFPMSVEGLHDALHTLEVGKMRYRGVVVAPE